MNKQSKRKKKNANHYNCILSVMRIVVFLFFFSNIISFAATGNSQEIEQQLKRKISGKITDKNGEPLIGANIVEKGTSNGTVTDLDGNFSLQIEEGGILTISYIGFLSQEIVIAGRSVVDIILLEDTQGLEELVVIGYGSVKKSDLTGAVSMVTSKELTRNPSTTAAQALQGKTTGVIVTQSAAPGGTSTIRVRGVGSINNNSNPIFIVDGMKVSNIEGIHPQDIENLQVLKDASAAAIYGANGSNGVIIINTKRGQSGKPVINFNAYTNFNLASPKYDMMNADEYSAFYSKIKGNRYEYSQEFREKYYGEGWREGTNWQDLLFKNGWLQNYNVSASGGGDQSNYNVSFAYTNDTGNVIKTQSESYNLRANSDFIIGKYVKVGENLNVRYGSYERPVTVETSIWDLHASPLMKVYNSAYKGGFESQQAIYWEDDNGNLKWGTPPSGYESYSNTLGNDKPNPIAAMSLSNSKTNNTNVRANAYVQIDFTDWLMFKTTPTIDMQNGWNRTWIPSFEGNRGNNAASLEEGSSKRINLKIENQILIKKNFNDVHNIQATLVQEAYRENYRRVTGNASGFNFETLQTLTNGLERSSSGSVSEYRMTSYLGRLIYDYRSKYYFTASFRRDAVSSFAPGYRSGLFSAFSAAWKLSDDFLQDVKSIDALKLRFGWGQTGNSDTSGNYFAYLDKITATNHFSPVFGVNQEIVPAQYIYDGMASPYMTWETAQMLNVGFDLNMLNNRLQAIAEYYVKDVDDLLIRKPIGAVYGRMNGNPWINAGRVVNKGMEVSLVWRDHFGKLDYGITTNFTTVENRVKNLVGYEITSGNNRTMEGYSIGMLYGYVAEGIIQSSDNYETYPLQEGVIPQPGDIKFANLNDDKIINSNDRTVIGKTVPSYSYSMGIELGYRNFDMNLFLYGVGDFDIFNAQKASLSSMNSQDMDHNKLADWAKNHWTPENPSTKYVRADLGNKNINDRISTFWIEDGSFLRIKDLQFGYNIPIQLCKRVGINNARVYMNAANLYCFTSYTGRDPEGFMSRTPIESGTDLGDYTIPRSFSLGLHLSF